MSHAEVQRLRRTEMLGTGKWTPPSRTSLAVKTCRQGCNAAHCEDADRKTGPQPQTMGKYVGGTSKRPLQEK